MFSACRWLLVAGFVGSLAAGASVRKEVAKLTSKNVTSGSRFGAAVAISPDHVVVGAPDHTADISGAVVVFQRIASGWFEQQLLIGSKVGPFDTFGFTVAIDGDRLVVGAPHADPAGGGFGFAYIFHRKGNTWVEEPRLESSGSADEDFFGVSVAISGDTVAVGASQESALAGAAYVFRFDGVTWNEEARLTALDAAAGDRFGHAVAIDGDIIVVGAPEKSGAREREGAAYLFRRTGGSWAQETRLVASGAAPLTAFGRAVSVCDGTAIVSRAGEVYVFQFDGAQWNETALLTASGGGYGTSISCGTNLLVVGAPDDDQAGSHAGAAYLYESLEGSWQLVHTFLASDQSFFLGTAVDLDSDHAVVGALDAAYVFTVRDPPIPAASTAAIVAFSLLLFIFGAIILRSRQRIACTR